MGQTEKVLSIDAKIEISEALNQSISEIVVTTMMAQNFHWNTKFGVHHPFCILSSLRHQA